MPKPNDQWRPIPDLSNLNKFIKAEKFKTEIPETITTSLQTVEWVTSIDFHIPIQSQSRKRIRFHIQGQTYQFKALLFGLSTVPMEFTVVAKEVKLIALQMGVRIHQYLDNWLVSQIPPNLSPAYTNSSSYMSGFGLVSEHGEIRAGPQTTIQLRRLPV